MAGRKSAKKRAPSATRAILQAAARGQANAGTGHFRIQGFVVAFIDLLGHGNKLLALRDVMSVSDIQHRLELAREALLPIKRFREAFKEYFDQACRANLSPQGSQQLTREQRQLARRLLGCSLDVRSFSDCIMLSVGLEANNRYLPANSLNALMVGCAAMVPTMLAYGAPIRGGIAIGFGSGDFLRDEVVSSAQVEAYQLEQTAARYPRIVISEQLAGFLWEEAREDGSTLETRFARSLAQQALGIVRRDADGALFLDFLSDAAFERLRSTSYLWMIRRAYEFVKEEQKRLSGHEKLGPRYDELVAYFEGASRFDLISAAEEDLPPEHRAASP